ncbi:MAG: hypothetical protein M1504_00580 [Candidatus Marsarchaeota archaeon]|nr:hypothetical protein [Candidatus Marsarchaeota archaeon]
MFNNRKSQHIAVITGVLLAVVLVASVLIVRQSSATSSGNVVANVVVGSVCYMGVSNTAITFENLNPNSIGALAAPTANLIVVSDNGGNAAYNIIVSGGNMVFDSNSFFVDNTLWNPISAGAGVGNGLTLTAVTTNIIIAAPTESTPTTSNNIYFGLEVPAGTPQGIYTNTITLGNTCNSDTNAITETENVQPYCYISVPSTITFGTMNPASAHNTNVLVLDTDPGGNVNANAYVGAANWISTGSANFLASNTDWNAATQSSFLGTNVLLYPSVADTAITVIAPTQATPATTNNIYFGLYVPQGTTAGTYTQNIVIENSC